MSNEEFSFDFHLCGARLIQGIFRNDYDNNCWFIRGIFWNDYYNNCDNKYADFWRTTKPHWDEYARLENIGCWPCNQHGPDFTEFWNKQSPDIFKILDEEQHYVMVKRCLAASGIKNASRYINSGYSSWGLLVELPISKARLISPKW